MKRSKWKGPLIKVKNISEKWQILSRNYEITTQTIGLIYYVYSGRKLVKLNITDKMIGHKVGEFVPTREKFEFKKKKKK